jgi:PHD/YefM family antitoxin component YafN of YafNO toxin-antitoxin module
MVSLHPNFITKKGKKEFVVIPYEEFRKIEKNLNDYEDLLDLRKAKKTEKNKPSSSLKQVKAELGL